MTRALVFVGAFNPPTNAHIALAGCALRDTQRETVLFVPSKSRYIEKDQGKDFAFMEEERLTMLRKIAKTHPWMRVCDWELRQSRQPRTYETLCHLREEGIDGALLVGSDKLEEMATNWLHVPEIAREFGIVALARGRDVCEEMIASDPLLSGLAQYIHVVQSPQDWRNTSSTGVRQRLREMQRLLEEVRQAGRAGRPPFPAGSRRATA